MPLVFVRDVLDDHGNSAIHCVVETVAFIVGDVSAVLEPSDLRSRMTDHAALEPFRATKHGMCVGGHVLERSGGSPAYKIANV